MRSYLLFFALLAPACGSAQPTFIKAPVRVDPCVNDLFFVDVPLELELKRIPGNFASTLERELTALAERNVGWFCAGSACNPLRGAGHLVARVARLLPERAGSKDDQRFMRVAFYHRPEVGSDAGAQRLIVRDAAACAAVSGITAVVEAHGGPAGNKFYVGRACTASGQQVRPRPRLRDDFDRDRLQPAVSDAMLSWHLERIQSGGAKPSGTPIVLVDTGVRDAIVPNEAWPVPPEVLPAAYDRDGEPRPQPAHVEHPHGTEMAVAMRQITDAPIIDLPVLGVNGRVLLGQVARAVDAAAAQLGDGPGVINLSLGWAPEIERVRKLNRGVCSVEEKPAGEAMRAVLARIRSAHPQVLVVAAGGNRARLGAGYLTRMINRHEATENGEAQDTDAFYPAQWGLRPTQGAPTVLAVGATQSTGRIAGMDQGQATLFAPGQHVYLQADGDAVDDVCAAGRTEVAFPRAVTGSSIAAAFISAAAARIWDARPDARASDAARLLYLAAEPMGVKQGDRLRPYVGINRVPGRRLNLRRLDKLLRTQPAAMRDCDEPGALFTGAPVSAACQRALEGLGFDEDLRAESDPVVWPRAREPRCAVDLGDASELRLRASNAPVCGGDVIEPACEKGDLYSAGDAGPQPEHDGCDDCMIFDLGDGTVRVQGLINPAYPEGTLITSPWLVAYWDNGAKATVDLASTGQTWAAGKSIDINGLKLDLGDLKLSEANVFLSTMVKTPSQTSATGDLSPVRVGDE